MKGTTKTAIGLALTLMAGCSGKTPEQRKVEALEARVEVLETNLGQLYDTTEKLAASTAALGRQSAVLTQDNWSNTQDIGQIIESMAVVLSNEQTTIETLTAITNRLPRQYTWRDVAAAQTAQAQAYAEAQAKRALLAKVLKTKVNIWGPVIQKIDDGLLVDSGTQVSGQNFWISQDGAYGAWGTCLLVGQTRYLDGEIINVTAYPDGIYSYTTVRGAQKTVRRYCLDPNAVTHPASKDEMWIINNHYH